jgi:Flp pilus assembly protein TadD
MGYVLVKICFAIIGVAMAVGCAARQSPLPTAPATEPSAEAAAQPPAESLETFAAKVRRLSAEARPPRPVLATIEGEDGRLKESLAVAAQSPSPATLRGVAAEYVRLGILDNAYQYLSRALALDPTDAATHDQLARWWRDSGFPHLGLGDAYRAAYYAPQSAVVRNTLGTLLQAMGRPELARREYIRAIQMDPSAAYAFNNLCYSWVLEGDAPRALAACQQAIALQPGFAPALNNLALAHAVGGNVAEAQKAFARSGDTAAALFNTGILHLAQRQYGSAVEAFQAAHALKPSPAAAARFAQARSAAAAAGE